MEIENQITEPTVTQEAEATPAVPAAEELASKGGWKPQEEWEGNPDDWIPAKEFNQRGELLDRIKTQSSHIKKLEKKQSTLETTLNELADHHRKVAETERKKALDDLKDLKAQALDIGDHKRVIEIDDRIDDLKSVKLEEKPKAQESYPEIEAWMEENEWYTTNKALRGAMDLLVQDVLAENPSMKGRVKDVINLAESKLREEFPSKFTKPRSTVTESSTEQVRNKEAKFNIRSLTDEQRSTAKRFIEAGAIKSYEEYAKQLADYDKRFGG